METYKHFSKLFSVAKEKGVIRALNYDIDVTLKHSRLFALETGLLAGLLYPGITDFVNPESYVTALKDIDKQPEVFGEAKPAIASEIKPKTKWKFLKYLQPGYYL